MRVLLSDASGLTSRQAAGLLAAAGHRVEVLATEAGPISRFTRSVRALHRVPAFGTDPLAWLDAAVAVAAARDIDLLLPVQEQVAVLALAPERITDLGVALAVPPFASLRQVIDKVSAARTLDRLGVAQPPTIVVPDAAALRGIARFPVYVKLPIGTASAGVRRVDDASGLARCADEFEAAAAFDAGGVVVQEPAVGPLVMVQAVYAAGRLVAWHANLRVREGLNGGAAAKQSVRLPELEPVLRRLGSDLAWHGALSMDVILTGTGPVVIDLNPRLVEPVNAARSGVDLVDTLLRVSLGDEPVEVPPGLPGTRTHQLLLGVLAAQPRGRGAVLAEVAGAVAHHGAYRDSREELTPVRSDWRSALPVVAATVAALAGPRAVAALGSGAVGAYALTAAGWRRLLDAGERRTVVPG